MTDDKQNQMKATLLEAVRVAMQHTAHEHQVSAKADQLAHLLGTVVAMQRLEGDTGHQALIEALCTLLSAAWVNYTFNYIRESGVYTDAEFSDASSELGQHLQAMLIEQSKRLTTTLMLSVEMDRSAKRTKAAKEAAQQDAERN